MCGTYVLGICGRYALDMLWVCGMYGGSGCGYVVVGISPGACDRQSVVVVVVARTHSHTRPSAAPTPPQPHTQLEQSLKRTQNVSIVKSISSTMDILIKINSQR